MPKLILCRHGQSDWNKKNLFTGWADVGLSEQGFNEAKLSGKIIKTRNRNRCCLYFIVNKSD